MGIGTAAPQRPQKPPAMVGVATGQAPRSVAELGCRAGGLPQRFGERLHARMTLVGLLGQRHLQRAASCAWDRRDPVVVGDWRGRARQVGHQEVLQCVGVKRQPPSQHLPRHDRERVLVAGARQRQALDLLRRHIGRCADDARRRCQRALLVRERPGQTKVDDLRDRGARGGLPQQHVARLDVPVHQPKRMRLGEPGGDLRNEPRGRRQVHRPVPLQRVVQRAAIDELHRQVPLVAGVTEAMHSDHVGMHHLGERPGLPRKPLLRLVVAVLAMQQLERYPSIQAAVAGNVHLAHATACQESLDDIQPVDDVARCQNLRERLLGHAAKLSRQP